MHLQDLNIQGSERFYIFLTDEVKEKKGGRLVPTGNKILLRVRTALRLGLPQLGGARKVVTISDLSVSCPYNRNRVGKRVLAAHRLSREGGLVEAMAIKSYHDRVLQKSPNAILEPSHRA